MLKTASSVVLASLKACDVRQEFTGGKVTIRSHVIEASGSSKLGMYLLGFSPAAALPEDCFEHPVTCGQYSRIG